MTQNAPASPETSFPGSGTASRLRAALKAVADELAVKHTSIAIVLPVKEVLATVFRVIEDVPRIPDYDPELAKEQAWRTATGFSHIELFDDPEELKVMADQAEDRVTMTVQSSADSAHVLNLDVAEAEGFFLAGLAAVAHLKRQRQ